MSSEPGQSLLHYRIVDTLGAKDEALLWLDRAIDRGMINYPFLSKHDR